MRNIFRSIIVVAGLFLTVYLLATLFPAYFLGQVFGATAEKNVTITIHKKEFVYCWLGNEKRPTVICDSLEMEDSFTMIDRFLEYLDSGMLREVIRK